MNNELFNAILAMDAYNRGYNGAIQLDEKDALGNYLSIGNATIYDSKGDVAAQNANFYALAYDTTGNGEADTIAYRGTDDPLGTNWADGDILTGWTVGAGSLEAKQAGLAIEFYRVMANVADYNTANIDLTGHSLGGGLAGLVGTIYGQQAYGFDAMPFLDAAENAKYELENGNADFQGLVYGTQTPWNVKTDYATINNLVHGTYIYGEALQSARNFISPVQPEFQNENSIYSEAYLAGFMEHVSGLDPVDLHSQATLVIDMFGDTKLGGLKDWEVAAQYFWPKLYDGAFAQTVLSSNLGKVQGTLLDSAQQGATAKYGDILRGIIAYSAIDEGERPFGDTAIRALYDDANDLGGAIAESSSYSQIDIIANDISKVFVHYSSLLALSDVEQATVSDAINGVLDLGGYYGHYGNLRINLSEEYWEDHILTSEHNLDFTRDTLVTSVLSAVGMNLGVLDIWGMEGASLIDRLVVSYKRSSSTVIDESESSAPKSSLFLGTLSFDTVEGSSGNDLLLGGGGGDSIYGLDGDDILVGGSGNDYLEGGNGYDVYIYNPGDGIDTIVENWMFYKTGIQIGWEDRPISDEELLYSLADQPSAYTNGLDLIIDVFPNSEEVGRIKIKDFISSNNIWNSRDYLDIDLTAGYPYNSETFENRTKEQSTLSGQVNFADSYGSASSSAHLSYPAGGIRIFGKANLNEEGSISTDSYADLQQHFVLFNPKAAEYDTTTITLTFKTHLNSKYTDKAVYFNGANYVEQSSYLLDQKWSVYDDTRAYTGGGRKLLDSYYLVYNDVYTNEVQTYTKEITFTGSKQQLWVGADIRFGVTASQSEFWEIYRTENWGVLTTSVSLDVPDHIVMLSQSGDFLTSSMSDPFIGDGDDNELMGLITDDFIWADGGDDLLIGGEGDDNLYGGDGLDSAVFSGNYGDYTIANDGLNYTVTDNVGDDGVDTLNGIESLKFSDGVYDLINEVFTPGAPANNAPIAVDDGFALDEDSVVSGNVLSNDSDADGDALTVTLESDVSNGTLALNADGSFTYTPDADYFGTDSFSYSVSDVNGGSDTATVNLTINDVAEPPVPTDAPSGSAYLYEGGVDIDHIADTKGVNLGHSLQKTQAIAFETGADIQSAQVIYEQGGGTRGLNFVIDGGTLYAAVWNKAEENWGFKELSFDVTANTKYTASLVMDGALPTDGSAALYVNGTLVDTISGVGKLYAHGDDIGVGVVKGSTLFHGSSGKGLSPFGGAIEKLVHYNEALDDAELSQLNAYLADGWLDGSAPPPPPANATPIAVDDAFALDEDSSLSGNILSNDSDADGDTLTAVLVSDVSNGTLVLNANGSFTYTPNADYFGVDSFSYSVSDGNGGSDTATVSLTINDVAEPPSPPTPPTSHVEVIVDNKDGAQTSSVGNWRNSSGPNPYDGNSVYTQKVGESFTWNPDLSNAAQYEVSAWWTYYSNRDQNATYEIHHVNGVSEVSVNQRDVNLGGQWNILGSYELDDSSYVTLKANGSTVSADAIRFVTGADAPVPEPEPTPEPPPSPANAAPIALDDAFALDEDSSLSGNVLSNDSDADGDDLAAVLVSDVSNGTLALNANGSFIYTPNADYFGADSFSYSVSDGNGGSDTATVNLTINDVAEPQAGERVIMEFGSVQADHNAVTVQLDHSFDDAVVFVTMTSFNDAQFASARITDVKGDQFSFYAQEADYLDGIHASETFSYLVVEKGAWALGDGTLIEAGTFEQTLPNGYHSVSFATDFAARPSILSQVQTDNDAAFVDTRQRNADVNGFEIRMHEEELYSSSDHGLENIGWLAIEQGAGSDSGFDFEAGVTNDEFTHGWKDILFDTSFDDLPLLLADVGTTDGGDMSVLRLDNVTQSGVTAMVQEEQSRDSEVWHTSERIDYFAISGEGELYGTTNTDVLI